MSINPFKLGNNLGQSTLEGAVFNLDRGEFVPSRLDINNGRIVSVTPADVDTTNIFIPPLVDAHMHVESTLATPAQIGAALLPHGVFATVSDPHEIANVLGLKGVEYMCEDAKRTACNILFGAPSCVPATHASMESSGATFGVEEVSYLLNKPEIGYLAEVMNFPGVLAGSEALLEMIAIAKRLGKPVDGHAPTLYGQDAIRYAAAGISTDHECVSYEEARFKAAEAKMHILIREGSAARNLEDLMQIVAEFPAQSMLCTDDLHPDLAVNGSINLMVKRLLDAGINPISVFRAACVNPVRHYGLDLGQLRSGDKADFIITKSLKDFYVYAAVKAGKVVAFEGQGLEQHQPAKVINNFHALPIQESDLKIKASGNLIRCIEVIDGQLITGSKIFKAKINNDQIVADPENDILKLVVLNRYKPGVAPSIGFVRNFGLKRGALASSVAHDSHNIIAVGVTDTDIAEAINQIIKHKGGLTYVDSQTSEILPLPVAGLMSTDPVSVLADKYSKLDALAKDKGGTTLKAPYMSLSFLALIVIQKLKLSDIGLFEDFQRVPVVFSE